MTKDPKSPEKYRLLEEAQSPDICDPLGDDKEDSPPEAKNQCLECPWTGPVVDGEWEYTDPRLAKLEKEQAAFERLLARFEDEKLIGAQYALEYLKNQRRRNCRPNTMRSSTTNIELFLSFLPKQGKTTLEQITRDDLFAFVEHEQDRGLTPMTVDAASRLFVVS